MIKDKKMVRTKERKTVKKAEDARIFPKATMVNIIKEITKNNDVQISKKAFEILHETSEAYLNEIFSSANDIANLRGSTQLSLADFKLATGLVNRMVIRK